MIYNQRDILRIIAKILNCSEDQLYKQSGLSKTLNWDSLNHVIILSTIEEYLKIKINDEMFSKLLTIGDIVNYLDNYQIEICIDEGQCNCGTLCFEEKKVEFKSLDGTNLVGVFCSTKQESKGFILLTHGIPSEKDENGFVINAVPSDVSGMSLSKFLPMFFEAIDTKSLDMATIIKDKLAQTACKAAVKGNKLLSMDEISHLVRGVETLGVLLCPHGRPIVVKLSRLEVDKWFKRK